MPQRQLAAIFRCALDRHFLEAATSGSGFVVIKPFFRSPQIFDEFLRNPRGSGDSILNKVQGLPLV
jgi:hypothetical protein